MQDIGRGTHPVVAARYTFRRLFMAGLTALLCDMVGFGAMILIKIRVIQELTFMACIGMGYLFLPTCCCCPLVKLYGSEQKGRQTHFGTGNQGPSGETVRPLWKFLDLFTQRKWATVAIICAVLLAAAGLNARRHLQIGDLDPGAPELRPDSRYNKDNAYVVTNYAASSDIFVVMVKTEQFLCTKYDVLSQVDALESSLRQLKGVISTRSFASMSKASCMGMNEGNLKWYELLRNQDILNAITRYHPDILTRTATSCLCSLTSLTTRRDSANRYRLRGRIQRKVIKRQGHIPARSGKRGYRRGYQHCG